MTRRGIKYAALGSFIAVLVLALAAPGVAQADNNVIVVEVRDDGYFCLKGCEHTRMGSAGPTWDMAIDVPQGQMVELTFIWAHEKHPQERHVMVLEDYGIESEQIDINNRQASLRFVANKTGEFVFYCDVFCDLHNNMQSAQVLVRRDTGGGASAAAPAFTSTAMALSASARTWENGSEPLVVQATLKDASGAPVSRAEVRFFVNAEFAGRSGAMLIGRARTNAQGVAELVYDAPLQPGDRTITARFTQTGIYDSTDQKMSIQVVGAAPSAAAQATRLEDLRGWGTTLLAMVILATWTMLGFALFQVVKIARTEAR
jgi:hypothetical protein